MIQKDVAFKITEELISLGVCKREDEYIMYAYILQSYAAGHNEGRAHKSKRRPVLQSTKGGRPIKVHESVKVAANMVGMNVASIGRALSGKFKLAGGYKWSYIDGKTENNRKSPGTQD